MRLKQKELHGLLSMLLPCIQPKMGHLCMQFTMYPHAGMRTRDTQLLHRGKHILAIGLMRLNGILDVYTTTGSVDKSVFLDFLECCVLSQVQPFNENNSQCPSHK